jgi:hypothetical protein
MPLAAGLVSASSGMARSRQLRLWTGVRWTVSRIARAAAEVGAVTATIGWFPGMTKTVVIRCGSLARDPIHAVVPSRVVCRRSGMPSVPALAGRRLTTTAGVGFGVRAGRFGQWRLCPVSRMTTSAVIG